MQPRQRDNFVSGLVILNKKIKFKKNKWGRMADKW